MEQTQTLQTARQLGADKVETVEHDEEEEWQNHSQLALSCLGRRREATLDSQGTLQEL